MTTERDRFQGLAHEICERRGWKCDGRSVDLDLEGGRHQQVLLDFFDFEEREMVRIFSRIGPTRRIRPDRLVYALELSFRMPFGSMAVTDETLVVVDTMMLADTDTDELEAAISYIAETADRYEASLFGSDGY